MYLQHVYTGISYFLINILNIKYDRTSRLNSLSLQSLWKISIPVSTITLCLKDEPNSQTPNFLSCLNLETSHLAIAAKLLWRPNERHMEECTDAVHILPACELKPAVAAVSRRPGRKSGSLCAWLAVGENHTCLTEFEGPTPAPSLRCQQVQGGGHLQHRGSVCPPIMP